MHILAQHRIFYTRQRIDWTCDQTAQSRHTILARIDALVKANYRVADAVRSQGISRATCYRCRKAFKEHGIKGLVPASTRPHSSRGRHWSMKDAARVLKLRRARPYAGKTRIHYEHNRLYPDKKLALATVGRIISWGLGNSRIQRCDFVERGKTGRRRIFGKGHAQRWNWQDRHKGGQIDHMSVYVNGNCLKEFRAVCPVTRQLYSRVYSRATAHNASMSLQEAATRLDIKSAQVDGGSEFMGVRVSLKGYTGRMLVSGISNLLILTVIDTFTRECLATVPESRLTSNDVVATLSAIAKQRSTPKRICCDNGP